MSCGQLPKRSSPGSGLVTTGAGIVAVHGPSFIVTTFAKAVAANSIASISSGLLTELSSAYAR
jgi:hypothetical protein